MDADAPLLGIKLLERYRLSAVLGRGASAVVYHAEDLTLQRRVALKLFDAVDDVRHRQRFLREVRSCAALRSPWVAEIYDAGLWEERPFMVSELLRGCTLAEALSTQPPNESAVAVEIVRQICWGLDAAHNAGFIHRDIKPHNVFLEECTPQPRVKLLDFGLAKPKGDRQLTEPGQILGSLAYASPEQLRDSRSVDERSDVYSVGVVLYQLVFGRLPHVATTRRGLELSITHDEPDFPVRSDVPVELELALRRALCKQPEGRYASAAHFARALPQLAARPYAPPRPPEAFKGTERLSLVRTLGVGREADVYEVIDRQSGEAKVVKLMRSRGADAQAKLRQEFRLLASVAHDNIVRYDELLPSPCGALLLMEKISGIPCNEHTTGSLPRIHAVARQLAAALLALHEHGIVHRDIKPQNVLVGDGERVVLIDFGLALPDGVQTAPRAGTPRFMPPETRDAHVSCAGDLFSFGVLLLELLLDRPIDAPASLPEFDALLDQVTIEHAWHLVDVCRALLHADPARRPSARQLVDLLNRERDAATSWPAKLPFVGRDDEVSTLDAWFDAETASVCCILGPAGIGKSTLVRRWSEQLRFTRMPAALVASCRCRPGEGVPYPAAEELVQSLVSELCAWPSDLARKALPPLPADLVRALPAFAPLARIVGSIESGSRDATTVPSPSQDVLAVHFAALVRAIAADQRVLLVIDDAQWLDMDTSGLLMRLLESAADHLRLLFISRDEQTATLEKILSSAPVLTRHVQLRPLSLHSCSVALGNVLPAAPLDLLRQVVDASAGVPYLLDLMLQEAQFNRASPALDLNSALQRRFDQLQLRQRELLELLAVATGPVDQEALVLAIGLSAVSNARSLVAMRLIRRASLVIQSHGQERMTIAFECYHDTIKGALLAGMSAERKRTQHSRLAMALRQQREPDNEGALLQLALAGDTVGSLELLSQAAARSRASAQFDRAAKLYSVALASEGLSDTERLALLLARFENQLAGDALLDAAETKLQMAELCGTSTGRTYRIDAAELLLCAGKVERGLTVLVPILDELGVQLPTTPNDAIADTMRLLEEVVPQLIGLDAPPSAGMATDAATEAGIGAGEVALLLAKGLSYVDVRSLYFLMLGLRDALQRGPVERLQEALALFVMGTASHLPNPAVGAALATCKQLTQSTPAPLARVLLYSAEAEFAHFEGKFLEAEAACESAERLLLDSLPTAHRELAHTRVRLVLLQYSQRGDYRSLAPRSREWLRVADSKGDAFASNWLRAAHALVWIAEDDAPRARDELLRAESEWTGGSGVFDVASALYHDVIDRYTGESSCAFEAGQGRSLVLQSPAIRTPFLGGYIHLHRAWVALRELAERRDDALRERVLECIVQLRSSALPSWTGAADAIEGNLDYLDRRSEPAFRLLGSAERHLGVAGLLSLAACARHRRGELLGGEVGERLRATAASQLTELGVAQPARFCTAYWSPFAVTQDYIEGDTFT